MSNSISFLRLCEEEEPASKGNPWPFSFGWHDSGRINHYASESVCCKKVMQTVLETSWEETFRSLFWVQSNFSVKSVISSWSITTIIIGMLLWFLVDCPSEREKTDTFMNFAQFCCLFASYFHNFFLENKSLPIAYGGKGLSLLAWKTKCSLKDRSSAQRSKESVFGSLFLECSFSSWWRFWRWAKRWHVLKIILLPHLVSRSNTSECTTRSAESAGVRQPARSKIRRHNNKLATVFNRSPNLRDNGPGRLELKDDPTELSSQLSAPGILKIFGSDICHGTNYKSVLATNRSNAKELVKEALER